MHVSKIPGKYIGVQVSMYACRYVCMSGCRCICKLVSN